MTVKDGEGDSAQVQVRVEKVAANGDDMTGILVDQVIYDSGNGEILVIQAVSSIHK